MVTIKSQERFRTAKGVFDEFTNRTLFELQSRNKFDELLRPIFVGKESNVFLARKGKKLVIVKIYRIQTCDFNRMYDYIKKDTRYEYLRKKKREIIFSWTQREYKNLIRAERAKINSPQTIAWKNNVLIEEMIGDDQPALPLKDVYPNNPQSFFDNIIKQVKLLYENSLIHGDLSAFNILNYNDNPYLIDFSQSTLVKTPNSEELLERDIKNIIKFFKKLGVNANFEQTIFKIKGKK